MAKAPKYGGKGGATLFLSLLVLTAALLAGCRGESVEQAVEAPGVPETAGEPTGETSVLGRNAASPSGSGATVGVASTAGPAETAGTQTAEAQTAEAQTAEAQTAEAQTAEAQTAEAQTAEAQTAGTETTGTETAETATGTRSSAQASSSGPEFVARPRARGGSGSGADSILAVRYGIHEGYERVVIDLGTGNNPAGEVPEWTLDTPEGDGLLRVVFPSVSTTNTSDGVFDGPLLRDYFVVRAPEDGMFVDVISEAAFTYRVLELSDPARLVVDFKPSSASLRFPLPAEGGNTVLVQPRRDARVSSPLTVSGYSRNFEANNLVLLTGPDGEVLAREMVTGNDWTATWGYFESTLDVPQFTGQATLKVGARSARDGTFEGVEIPVSGSR